MGEVLTILKRYKNLFFEEILPNQAISLIFGFRKMIC